MRQTMQHAEQYISSPEEATQELIHLIEIDSADTRKAQQLFRAGADINAIESYPEGGEYPLLVKAVIRQNYPMVNFVLERGANPNVYLIDADGKKQSALDMAAKQAKRSRSNDTVSSKIQKEIQIAVTEVMQSGRQTLRNTRN